MFNILVTKIITAVIGIGMAITGIFVPDTSVYTSQVIKPPFVDLGPITKAVENLQNRIGDIETEQMLGSFTPVQSQKFRLSGSGVTASQTTITLQSFKLPDAVTTITMSMIGSTGYGTLEPGTAREEQISFTGVTQNANGTATLTGVSRGIPFSAPFTASSSLQKAHAGSTYFILSNTSGFYSEYAAKTNNEFVTGTWTYASSAIPRLSTAGTWGAGSEEYLITKRYADALVLAGAPNASQSQKGIVYISNLGSLITGSSTYEGGVFQVPHAGLFNATSSATSTVPIANLLESSLYKISPSYIATSSNYAWSGTHTYTNNVVMSTATTTSAIDAFNLIPAGIIQMWASSTAPSGWLLADGTAYPTSTYPRLFAVIGYTYGSSSNNFRVPDFGGRNALGVSSTYPIATSGGSSTHVLTTDELAAHTHGVYGTSGGGAATSLQLDLTGTVPPGGSLVANAATTVGSSTAFSVIDPYLAIQYIIKY